jgi:intracellular sulfur oxidation DsrE/DsrF family protein
MSMFKIAIAVIFILALPLAAMLSGAAAAPIENNRIHHIVIQVDSDDLTTMRIALGNSLNAKKYYDSKGETVVLEIVTYGPGITMLRSDTSPVKDQIEAIRTSIPGITLSMCNNAKELAEKREGKTIIPLPGVQIVPAGIVRVVELQEQGYSYVRP